MFAIIETGGKQYKISPDSKIKIEKLNGTEGQPVVFDKILLLAQNDKVEIGRPYLNGVKAEGIMLQIGREKKKIVFKYHSKARYKKTKGHRQYFSEVKISKIQ